DHQPEREKRNLLQGLMQQQANVLRAVGDLIQQAQLDQVFGRDGKRDGIAHGLVETVVGAVAERWRQLVISALVEIVAQFVVNGEKIFVRDLDAHLQAQ